MNKKLSFKFKFDSRKNAIEFQKSVQSIYQSQASKPVIDTSRIVFNEVIIYGFSNCEKDMKLLEKLIFICNNLHGSIC